MIGETIIHDFPILARTLHQDKKLIYLDSAATSQKPTRVIEAMDAYYRQTNANVHRGIHALAEESTRDFESARKRIADFVGVNDEKQIIFTRNTTESINLIAKSWGQQNLQPGDLILLTEMEHHSNIVPWYMLRDEKNIRIEFIRITPDGKLDLEHLASLLKLQPRLVSFMHVSNVLGTVNPAKAIVQSAHEAGAIVVIDGAQSIPHMPVDIIELGADFYAFSAHKMCGPTGIGVLFGKKEMLESMSPFLGGGDMIKKVTFEGYKANELPYKFEAGTPAIAEAIGFGAAIDYLASLGMEEIYNHEKQLASYAYDALSEIEGLEMLGPGADERCGVLSFTLEGIHPHDIAQLLDQVGIAVRAGHHCAMPLHEKLAIPASTRASLYLYNSKADVDALISGLRKVIEVFN
jgi:cysteine desulfurase / selenocysteine lyase